MTVRLSKEDRELIREALEYAILNRLDAIVAIKDATDEREIRLLGRARIVLCQFCELSKRLYLDANKENRA